MDTIYTVSIGITQEQSIATKITSQERIVRVQMLFYTFIVLFHHLTLCFIRLFCSMQKNHKEARLATGQTLENMNGTNKLRERLLTILQKLFGNHTSRQKCQAPLDLVNHMDT